MKERRTCNNLHRYVFLEDKINQFFKFIQCCIYFQTRLQAQAAGVPYHHIYPSFQTNTVIHAYIFCLLLDSILYFRFSIHFFKCFFLEIKNIKCTTPAYKGTLDVLYLVICQVSSLRSSCFQLCYKQ